MKHLVLTFLGLMLTLVSFAIYPITGTAFTCTGSSTTLSDSTTGGTWSSSNIAIATVSSAGIVTGVSAGTCTITYTVALAYVTASYTVSGTFPAAITGTTSFCMGTSSALSDATSGGAWSSSNPGIAPVSATTGLVTGVAAGSATITYSLPAGCSVTDAVTITTTATVDPIAGLTSVCPGSTITLTDATSGGVWSSTVPSEATVSSSGVVTGISPGSDTIYYTVTTSCGSATAGVFVTVGAATSVDTITGTTSIALGTTATLSDGVACGTWTSSNTAVATVGSSTGVVTGVAVGSATITYTVSGGCSGSVYTTAAITVSIINRISGNINFTSGPADSSGTLKIWLITYNPADSLLEAVDSLSSSAYGTSIYYQFLGEVADSYRVKAAYFPATFIGTGYIPTYHTGSYYWSSANVFYHSATGTDDGKDINMAFGAVTSGPGFVSGNVYMGANRGTGSAIPSIGLLIYLMNASGAILQQTYTDATGAYTFGSLALGNYTVYPELINYNTTAYTSINLTASSPSMSSASFMQHTVSLTITPMVESVKNKPSPVSAVIVFPSPTSGKLNIQWNENATEKCAVTVSDLTGRIVYAATLNMAQGAGSHMLDLTGLNTGLYIITVKSATIDYNSKIEVQH